MYDKGKFGGSMKTRVTEKIYGIVFILGAVAFHIQAKCALETYLTTSSLLDTINRYRAERDFR